MDMQCRAARRLLVRASPLVTVIVVVVASFTATSAAAINAPRWQPATLADHSAPFADTGGMSAVSCMSDSACVAFDFSGRVLTSTDPTGGPAAWTPTTFGTAHGLIEAGSCPSPSLCVATDDQGDVITSSNPLASIPTWRIAKISANQIRSVSCPTASLCVAAEQGGNLLSSDEPTGGPAAW